MSLDELARKAARAAARLRADLGIAPTEGLCPLDIADLVGVPVRILALSSLEGMYSPDPRPTILLGAERPAGRRRYTCGHELGHHIFGHGVRIDEIDDELTGPEEYLAQRFSAALIMPKLVIEAAFVRRRWSIASATPQMMFTISQELGVGFTTLIEHLARTLGLLRPGSANALRRVKLPQLRTQIAGAQVLHDVVVVDEHWGRKTIDIEIGDLILVPKRTTFSGTCADFVEGPIPQLLARAQGTGNLSLEGDRGRILVRVSRRTYTGLGRYRHLEDIDDDK